ncbi:uncharacterized protein JCM15063_001678 [Sporobolomyces koalae]|uniref:uncharacterized protein n=1 Tax=Sporobolomyces koalae TaxID=500713 RepID=UPI00317DDD73
MTSLPQKEPDSAAALHTGPAWTRPKTTPKKHKARSPYTGTAAAAGSSSSISLGNPQASTSSLTLASSVQNEAPYLTHKHRHHGQLTLVAPDNLGARRQAGTLDHPAARVDARGGFGVPGLVDGPDARPDHGPDDRPTEKQDKKKKKKKRKEEEQQKQRQILAAVSNAGRTPSPNPSNAPGTVGPRPRPVDATPNGPSEMARSSSGQAALTVPPHASQPRERRSRSRSRSRRAPPITSHRRSLSPTYLPPPSLDDPSLESQISLGLVDPSILLSPPPPAYDLPPPISSFPADPPPSIHAAPSSQSATPSIAAPGTPDSEEDDDDADESGPPDPLVIAWEEDRLTGLYSLDERISRDLDRRRAAEDASKPAGSSQDDQPLAEEPPTAEEVEEAMVQGEDDLNEIKQAEASRDSRRLSRALSRHASRRYTGVGGRRSTLLTGPNRRISTLGASRSIEETQPSVESQTPSPSPASDPSASQPVSHLPTVIEPSSSAQVAGRPTTPARPATPTRTSLSIDSVNLVPPPLMSPAESSAVAAEFPSPSPSQASPSLSNSPYLSDREDDQQGSADTEQRTDEAAEANEVEETEETDEQALARRVTRTGRGLAALAAERRMRLEKEAKQPRDTGLAVSGTIIEQIEEETEEPTAIPDEPPQEKLERPRSPAAEGETILPSIQMPDTMPLNIPVRRQQSNTIDNELSFSQPSSRSLFPRPAPLPQLVPLAPVPTPFSSQQPSLSAMPAPSSTLAKPAPPPVPPRRSVGRRSLDEPALVEAFPAVGTTTLNRTASGRRIPPPPPPINRDGTRRTSVLAMAAALENSSAANSEHPLPSPSMSHIPHVLSPPSTTDDPTAASTPLPTSAATTSLPAPVTASDPPRRHRPLPIPPVPLSQDRIDAFTALRAVQGNLSPEPRSGPTALARPSESVSSNPDSGRPVLHARMSSSSSSSSVENPGPPLPRRPPRAQPVRPEDQLSAYTDLDLLLARLERETNGDVAGQSQNEDPGQARADGTNYDDLLTLGEIMGNVAPAGASPEEIAEHLTVARVELERRRVDKRGKVKTKLSVVGVRCVDCSICMSRFRVDDFAVVLSNCLHIFHETCIRSWFRRSRQCPVCRADVFPPRPLIDLTQ